VSAAEEYTDALGRPIDLTDPADGFVHAKMSHRKTGGGFLIQTWCGKGNRIVGEGELFVRWPSATCPKCVEHERSCSDWG
jgi:hypothetical protein